MTLSERLRAYCIDFDGSQMKDLASPLDGMTCGEVREAADELDRLTARVGCDFELLSWAYSKLVHRSFDNMDDALTMDKIKLMLLDDRLCRRTGG